MLKTLTTAAFVMLTLSACSSSASIVRKDGLGGRVQLSGAYVPAMEDARMLMVERCNGRYEAVEAGNAVEFRCKAHGATKTATGTEVAVAATSKGL
ncbi:MAG: hypothetical protein ACHQ53_16905 [Polyangiales bacterium]